jgi:hypothetical protein
LPHGSDAEGGCGVDGNVGGQGPDPSRRHDHGAYPGHRPDGGPLFTGIGAVCETAARLAGADGAAVAVLTASTRVRELVYATDAISQQIDELQFTVGEGPCLDAYLHDRPELYPDLDAPDVLSQWPAFCVDAVNLGARAVFAFPVPGQQRPLGVLELYRRTVGGLADREKDSAMVCAKAVGKTLLANWESHATHSISTESAIDTAAVSGAGFREPTDPFTRSQVYVAAGMVAVQLAVSAEEALDRLRAYSYARGLSVTAVAADIVARRLSLRDQRDDVRGV